MLLPTMLGVGVWAGCLLHTSKVWYDVVLDSPIKLPFYVFGGVWCGESLFCNLLICFLAFNLKFRIPLLTFCFNL